MSLSTLDTASAAMDNLLVTFTWGATPTVARYVRGTSSIMVDGQLFKALPSMKAEFAAQQGGTEDVPIFLTMDMRKAPMDKLCLPYVHSKVRVVIERISPGTDASRFELFSGRISRITVKPGGNQGVCKAKIVGVKARLNATLGVPATTTCIHQFGDENQSMCGLSLAARTLTGDITALYDSGKPNRVTVSIAGSPDLDNVLFNRGYIEYDDLRIMIRASLGGGLFELKYVPPPYWMGKTVKVVEGCDKKLTTCRHPTRNNEVRLLAFGRAMTGRNPLFEEQ